MSEISLSPATGDQEKDAGFTSSEAVGPGPAIDMTAILSTSFPDAEDCIATTDANTTVEPSVEAVPPLKIHDDEQIVVHESLAGGSDATIQAENTLPRTSRPKISRRQSKERGRRRAADSVARTLAQSASPFALRTNSAAPQSLGRIPEDRKARSLSTRSRGTVPWEKTPNYYNHRRQESSGRVVRQRNFHGQMPERARNLISPSFISLLSTISTGTNSSDSSATLTANPYERFIDSNDGGYTYFFKRRRRPEAKKIKHESQTPQTRGEHTDRAESVFKYLDSSWKGEEISAQRQSNTLVTSFDSVDMPNEPAGDGSADALNFLVDNESDVVEEAAEERISSSSDATARPQTSSSGERATAPYEPPYVETFRDDERPEQLHRVREHPEDSTSIAKYQDVWPPRADGGFLQSHPQVQPYPILTQHQSFPSTTWQLPPKDQISYQDYRPADSSVNLTGYEQLASKLSAWESSKEEQPDRLVPVYRRFEPLQHRILLHLQDQICESEEQLRRLDEWIARSQQLSDGTYRPSSRRDDRVLGNEAHSQRTTLLGNICMTMKSYSEALQSYQAVVTDTEHASKDEIRAYKAWLRKHKPISDVESRFLEYKYDLARAGRSKTQLIERPGSKESQALGRQRVPSPRSMIIGLLTVFCLTIAAIRCVEDPLGRLFVLTMLACGGYIAMQCAGGVMSIPATEVFSYLALYVGVAATVAGALK